MFNETDISEAGLTERLRRTREAGAPARNLAGIYAEMTDFYLGEAAAAYPASSSHAQEDNGYSRIVALQDHDTGAASSRFAALRSFAPECGSNPYAGSEHAAYFCRRAAEGLCADSPREKDALHREIAQLAAEQQRLISKLAQRLLEQRRDAIAALARDAGYTGSVKKHLEKASEAAQAAVQSLQQDAIARPAAQRGPGGGG